MQNIHKRFGIKNYTNCFPNAKFVLDPFHYIKKHLKYIFKDEYRITIEETQKALNEIRDKIVLLDQIKDLEKARKILNGEK